VIGFRGDAISDTMDVNGPRVPNVPNQPLSLDHQVWRKLAICQLRIRPDRLNTGSY